MVVGGPHGRHSQGHALGLPGLEIDAGRQQSARFTFVLLHGRVEPGVTVAQNRLLGFFVAGVSGIESGLEGLGAFGDIKLSLGVDRGPAILVAEVVGAELEVAASMGLSAEYLNKGPLSAIHSIARSLKDGPVVIEDVTDDPRLQYPEEAKKEGISSILSVPIVLRENPIGVLRVYAAEPWEATLEDVNFVQAIAQISGMALEMSRLYKGLKDSIEILKAKRGPKTSKSKR